MARERYDDVVTVLKDARFGKDKRKVLTAEQLARLPWIPAMLKLLDVNAPTWTSRTIPGSAACEPGVHARLV